MSDKKVVLNFPPEIIDQPIIYRLIQEGGLVVKICRPASVPTNGGEWWWRSAAIKSNWVRPRSFLRNWE